MPRIIEYSDVLARLTADGLRCQYYNGGAFGFDSGQIVRGWISEPDETIRQEMRENIRIVAADKQAGLAMRAWMEVLRGIAWIMPASNWSYELNFGSRNWLSGVLKSIGIDSDELVNRTDAAGIEFGLDERRACESFVAELLKKLTASDFTLAFPGRGVVCTIHHHGQLWWVMKDSLVADGLDQLVFGEKPH